ncbi:MAG: homoserine O-acetyltransferase [Bacteroides sp.]|nr:homoserine O-acetyltransferase [Bacteroides sp.]MCM1458092.1 homoserine O-acetyltransferase [Lachnoclostridium sp.]
MKTYTHHGEFPLESGGSLKDITIAYHTYGTLSARADNVVWVCHALTANSDVADWWPGTVAPGRFLDPERYFIVCANILGSCYGSTGPLSVNPDTGEPYYRTFPRLTMRDVVAAHRILADALGIGRIHAIIGSSVGGFQAVEWAVAEPERFGRVALIATDAKASPWTIAIDETQRMAILADPTYALDRPDGGAAGLAAARAIGLLTYRGGSGYNITQQDATDDYTVPHRACTYQRYQGSKLVGRFDAYSYMAILDTFDTHNVGRGRGTLRDALARITAPTLVVGLGTDIIFTPGEMQALASMIPGAEYRQIESPFGHDGFLVEADRLNEILLPFIEG